MTAIECGSGSIRDLLSGNLWVIRVLLGLTLGSVGNTWTLKRGSNPLKGRGCDLQHFLQTYRTKTDPINIFKKIIRKTICKHFSFEIQLILCIPAS